MIALGTIEGSWSMVEGELIWKLERKTLADV